MQSEKDSILFGDGILNHVGQKRMEIDCRQKWKEIIEEMRYYFLESNEDTCTKYPYSDMSHDDYFKKHDEIYNYQIECRKKAFDLLCKWSEWLGE